MQIRRNKAARRLFADLLRTHPEIDRAWLREQLNDVVLEELRLVRRDVVQEAIRSPHYHGELGADPRDAVLTARKVIANIDRRIAGEHI